MNPQLLSGLVDALGFVLGALLGLFIAKAFGADPMAAGYGSGSVVGILLCGLGGGAGLQIARWVVAKMRGRNEPPHGKS
jgi:hypothetical protein